jgi:alpha-tubulin suppressor-like RCC1 family protein
MGLRLWSSGPESIEGLLGVRLCSAGALHTICVMEDSTVKTFGDAQWAQLGYDNGPIEVEYGNERKTDQLTPKTVEGLVGVRSCSAGYHSSVSILCCENGILIYFSLVHAPDRSASWRTEQ